MSKSLDQYSLLILLLSFLFSLFLWSELGLFLLFPLAFVLTSLITHIRFSVSENDCSTLPWKGETPDTQPRAPYWLSRKPSTQPERNGARLTAATLVLREALLAVDWTISAGLEGNLALLVTVCTGRLVHLPRLPVESTTTLSLKRHGSAPFNCWSGPTILAAPLPQHNLLYLKGMGSGL